MLLGGAFLEFSGSNKYIYVEIVCFNIKYSYDYILENNKMLFENLFFGKQIVHIQDTFSRYKRRKIEMLLNLQKISKNS